MDRIEKEARGLLKEHGTFVRDAKQCVLYKVGDHRVSISKTPSCPRAWLNNLADIRNAIRLNKADQKEAPVANKPHPPAYDVAQALGIIPQTSTKIVTVTKGELRVSKVQLLSLLDKAGAKIPVEPQHVRIDLEDDGGVFLEWAATTEEEK